MGCDAYNVRQEIFDANLGDPADLGVDVWRRTSALRIGYCVPVDFGNTLGCAALGDHRSGGTERLTSPSCINMCMMETFSYIGTGVLIYGVAILVFLIALAINVSK